MENDSLASNPAPETESQGPSVEELIAIDGLRQLTVRQNEKEQEDTVISVPSEATESSVLANTRRHALLAGTNQKENPLKETEWRTRLGYHTLRDGTLEKKDEISQSGGKGLVVPYTTLRPISRKERAEALKTDRKIRKNMRAAVVNSNLARIYNETIDGKVVAIGTPEHETMITGERLSRSERRAANRAIRLYKRNQKKIDNRLGPAEKLSQQAAPPNNTTKESQNEEADTQIVVNQAIFRSAGDTQKVIQEQLNKKLVEIRTKKSKHHD